MPNGIPFFRKNVHWEGLFHLLSHQNDGFFPFKTIRKAQSRTRLKESSLNLLSSSSCYSVQSGSF